MNIIKRVSDSIKQYGLRGTFYKFIFLVADYLFDLKYGTNTFSKIKLSRLTIESQNRDRGSQYQATRIIPLKKLLKVIKSSVPSDSVFVDIGCGKGRALLIAAEIGFKKLRGVEFSKQLAENARINCRNYSKKTNTRAVFSIIIIDAVEYKFGRDENVFFMYHPFDEIVMGKVINNICGSIQKNPRKIWIIYHNPIHSDILTKFLNLEVAVAYNLYGHNFHVYSN